MTPTEINAERVIGLLQEKVGEAAGREAVQQVYIEMLERKVRELEARNAELASGTIVGSTTE